MAIRVVCPNGHEIKVKDSLAGKSGLCPMCKAPIKVPEAARPELTEDAILGILGNYDPGRSQDPATTYESEATASEHNLPTTPPKKVCQNCDREISAAIHICPHCHTYIAGLKDF